MSKHEWNRPLWGKRWRTSWKSNVEVQTTDYRETFPDEVCYFISVWTAWGLWLCHVAHGVPPGQDASSGSNATISAAFWAWRKRETGGHLLVPPWEQWRRWIQRIQWIHWIDRSSIEAPGWYLMKHQWCPLESENDIASIWATRMELSIYIYILYTYQKSTVPLLIGQ